MDKLLNSRNRIDQIDDQIMSLLDERYNLSIEIGNIKKESNAPILDSNREKTILYKTSKLGHSHAIENVYLAIIKESKNLQRK